MKPMNQDLIRRTVNFVQNELYSDASGHDWWHVYRVWNVAKVIAAEMGNVDLMVVELAALLHDISDYKLNGGDHEAGPAIAEKWLASQGIDEAVCSSVADIIRTLGFKNDMPSDRLSLEAKIIQDSDNLDAIGAIGIARAFAFGGHRGDPIYLPEQEPVEYASRSQYIDRKSSSVNHFYEKLLKLKDNMNTEIARKIAHDRHNFLIKYLDRFFEEWTGSDI